jgi:hypothetical protein
VLTLQRNADIFQCGQMRKYRRDLERAHQAKTGNVRRRHRADVFALVENLAFGGLQKLGEQIEAHRLAGAIRPDQRVNGTLADLEIDVANGVESRELFGQTMSFEDDIVHQKAAL